MRAHSLWLIASLVAPLPLVAQEEGSKFGIWRYNWTLPVGDTKDYVDNDSWVGFSLEGRRFIDPSLSVGVMIGWTELYERTDEPIDFSTGGTGGTVSGEQYRHIGVLPVMLGGQRYFGRPGGPRPHLGLYGGVYYVRQLLDIGLSEFTEDDLRFGIAPELGIAVPVRSGVAVVLSSRYDVPFSGGDFLGGPQSFQHWSLGFGVAYLK